MGDVIREQVTAQSYGGEYVNGVPIVPLGDDGDTWTAYGHHPLTQFAEACREYLGSDAVRPEDARHVHAVMEHGAGFDDDEGYTVRWRNVTPEDLGAFPLTVWAADEVPTSTSEPEGNVVKNGFGEVIAVFPPAQAHECVPTQDAYDAAVRALEKHRARADAAEAQRDRHRTALERIGRPGTFDRQAIAREALNRPAADPKPCAPSRRCVNCQGVPQRDEAGPVSSG